VTSGGSKDPRAFEDLEMNHTTTQNYS